jgi:hypothetical protein
MDDEEATTAAVSTRQAPRKLDSGEEVDAFVALGLQ